MVHHPTQAPLHTQHSLFLLQLFLCTQHLFDAGLRRRQRLGMVPPKSLMVCLTLAPTSRWVWLALSLPRAQGVLDDLERAASSRLISLTEVIQARRTLDELLFQEAASYADAYQASVDLLAALGPGRTSPPAGPEASP